MQRLKRIRRWLIPRDWPIAYKLAFGLLVVVGLMLAVNTYVDARNLQNELRSQIGVEFETLAGAQMRHLTDILSEQFTILRNISVLDQVRIDAVTATSQYPGDRQAAREELAQIDREWLASDDESQLVRSLINPLHSSIVFQLINYRDTFPDIADIFLTDGYGGLLAATRRPDTFYQGDETWWQAAYDDGRGAFYVGQPEPYAPIDASALRLSIPILSEGGEVVGVACMVLRLEAVQQVLDEGQFGETGRFSLVDSSGVILADSLSERRGLRVFPLWGTWDSLQGERRWQELVDERGVPTLAGHALISDIDVGTPQETQAIQNLDWGLFVQQSQAEAYRPVNSAVRTGVLTAALFGLFAIGLGMVVGRLMIAPIGDLMSAAQKMAAGDLSARAVVRRQDETGELAEAFNTMARELGAMVNTLEQRVADRMRSLQTAAEVSRAVTSVLDPEELLNQVVDLVGERFDYYYVGLFLVDSERRFAVLHAGTGSAGQQMLAAGHRLEIGGDSMIGQCVARSEARIALDVGEEAVRFENPYLPRTRSEMALPLRSRGRVIGAMTVQSAEESAFDEADIAVLQTVADQVAVAIDNARLFSETQTALEEMEATHRRYLREEWRTYRESVGVVGYETEQPEAPPLGDEVLAEIRQAIIGEGPVLQGGQEEDGRTHSALVVPVALRGEVIGALGVQDEDGTRQWTDEEIALVQVVAERMALAADNLRLLDESQRRAAREQLVSDISARIRTSLDPDVVLKTTVRELGRALGVERASIEIAGSTSNDADSLAEENQ